MKKEKTKKVLIGLGIAGAGIATYYVYKKFNIMNKEIVSLKDTIGKMEANFMCGFEVMEESFDMLDHALTKHGIDVVKEWEEKNGK